MRIVSSFKDYYDGLQRNDQDKTTTFVRPKTEYFSIKMPKELEYLYYRGMFDSDNHGNRLNCIGFVDQLYWWPSSELQKFLNRETFFDYRFPKIATQHMLLRWQSNASKLFELLGPMWIIHDVNYYHDEKDQWGMMIRGHKYPKFADYNLAKVLPPHEAYEKLYRYVANQQMPEKPIPVMPNDVKIELAGFDLKKSFRKPKKK